MELGGNLNLIFLPERVLYAAVDVTGHGSSVSVELDVAERGFSVAFLGCACVVCDVTGRDVVASVEFDVTERESFWVFVDCSYDGSGVEWAASTLSINAGLRRSIEIVCKAPRIVTLKNLSLR